VNFEHFLSDGHCIDAFVRYIHVRILLLRPLLSELFDTEHAPPNDSEKSSLLNTILQQTILTSIFNICISTAQKQIDHIYRKVNAGGTKVYAWRYSVYCTSSNEDRHCTMLTYLGKRWLYLRYCDLGGSPLFLYKWSRRQRKSCQELGQSSWVLGELLYLQLTNTKGV
jgi:hypothetical protein